LLVIFALDRATGSAPVQHLYYLPIVGSAIWLGMSGAVAASLASIAFYHLANAHVLSLQYRHSDILQIATFLAAGVATARVTSDARRLKQLAMTDDLTGLHNLRSFESILTALVRGSIDSGDTLALFVLDVDRLKLLNDEHGHLAGADAVRTVGHIIAATIPANAVACRYGGDEFVVAVPGCLARGASRIADHLRRQVNAASPALTGIQFAQGTLSVSIGVACRSFHSDSESSLEGLGEALFREADQALYRAKARGRNQVCVV